MDYPLQSVTNCQTHFVQVNQDFPYEEESLYCNLTHRNLRPLPPVSSPPHEIFIAGTSSSSSPSSLKPFTPLLTRWGSKACISRQNLQPLRAFYRLPPLTLSERLSCPWVPLSYCNPYTIPTHLMGETPAIKQRVHFAGSNLAFKQYAKVCVLGTILLLGYFPPVRMQSA